MPKPDLMPVGVDFGLDGGIVAIDGTSIVFAQKTPTFAVPVVGLEADAAKQTRFAQYKRWHEAQKVVAALPAGRAKAGKKGKKPKAPAKRYLATGELMPKSTSLFETDDITELLRSVRRIAMSQGYVGIFVAIEEPQMFIGRSSVTGYFASGRCANAWLSALDASSVPYGYLSPKHWKTVMGLSDDKDMSLKMAAERFSLPPYMLDDHDLCEAALIADFLRTHAPRYLTITLPSGD